MMSNPHWAKEHRTLSLTQRGTGQDAIGIKAPGGCVLVQFNRIDHPHGHGWHLYPRHHFTRRRRK